MRGKDTLDLIKHREREREEERKKKHIRMCVREELSPGFGFN